MEIEFCANFRELGHVVHFNFGVVDCVLLAFGRNYSTNITSHSIVGQIFAVHNDSGLVVRLDDGVRFEYPF